MLRESGIGGPGLFGGMSGFFRAMAFCLPAVSALAIVSGGCYDAGREPRTGVEELAGAPDEYGNVIPDFSHAGYMGGGVAIPEVPVVKELSPKPAGDDRERIQSALDAVSEMEPGEDGFRGAVLLRAGDYRVDGYLHIRESGVVLRGEGQFEDGTTITATKLDYVLPGRRRNHSLIYLGRHDDSRTGFLTKENETLLASEAVPVGSREIRVRNTDGFGTGDDIVVEVYPNTAWLETLGLSGQWSGTARGGTRFYYERRITGIEGDRFSLDAPLTFYLDRNHLRAALVWSYSGDGRISRSGVENLRLRSYFTDENYDGLENFAAEERHAWSAVRVEPVRDCWVRNVTALHFPHAAVEVNAGARNVTVQDCAFIRPVSKVSGDRRYPFRVEGTRVLVQRCYAREARHAFASSSAGLGLNVFLDCAAENNYGDIGPHMYWAAGYLYDNVLAPRGTIAVRFVGGRHGWRGANHVLWNCRARQIACDDPETGDTNWSVGSVASRRSSPRRARFGRWISYGRHVEPRSLYLYQLGERMGEEAVRNITTGLQREGDAGRIFEYLKGKYAELTEWEKANDGNVIPDPGFRIAAPYPRWITTEKLDKPFEFDEYRDPVPKRPVCELERDKNPVFGDDSAVMVPAGRSLRAMPFSFLDYGSPSREKAALTLSFDYRMDAGESFNVSVIHNTIRTGTDEEGYGLYTYGKERWERSMVFTGPPVEGKGRWDRYSFDFVVVPEFYRDTGMTYPAVLAVKFSSRGGYSLANPCLRQNPNCEYPGL